jgi:hypothetical protein
MDTPLKDFAADHRFLIHAAAQAAGFTDPVAVSLDEFKVPLFEQARRQGPLPIDGVLVRDWDPDNRRNNSGVHFGLRIYRIDGVAFVDVQFPHDDQLNRRALDFIVVDRKNYGRLYKSALRCRMTEQPPCSPPVLPPEQLSQLWKNTIGYLESANLDRIRAYGGRAKRGVLLTGAPGNGKTMASRWIWEACRKRRWEYRLVTPDSYRAARHCRGVDALFTVAKRGVIFFDDMDLALRDRETTAETEDQAIFLGALDGITVNEGVVFVFTTNCGLDLIDRAFKRPGRLDVVMHFRPPDAPLRRRLFDRWHQDVRNALDLDEAVRSTEGYSFADIEELKNLLVMQYMEVNRWDWDGALKQFAINRSELIGKPTRAVGFVHNHNGSDILAH